ncbi:MAG: rhamnogalacturonan acetylesterase [Opitutaceae bacterium]
MTRSLLIFSSFVSTIFAATALAQAAVPQVSVPLRIAIIGDSTVSEYPETRPDRGWGQFVEERFLPGTVKASNLPVPGRSTKTFIQAGDWEKTLQGKPNYVLIQFGHNDSHAPENRESTDPAIDYKDYLRKYIDESRAAGATPILVSPMVRRAFDEAGKFSEAPTGRNRPLGSYAAATREVGQEKKVAVIDLYASSLALAAKLGPVASAEFANKSGDGTHFNEKGARAMADLVMRELPRAAPDLVKLLTTERAATGGKR